MLTALSFLAAEVDKPSYDPLLQYGAIGTLLVLLGIFAFRAYSKSESRFDALQIEMRTAIADKDKELKELHQSMTDKLIPLFQDNLTMQHSTQDLLREMIAERKYRPGGSDDR